MGERLDRGVATLQSWGLTVQVMPHARQRAAGGMFAGTDAQRAADLEQAWCEPMVRAVFCARGGYGASRVIDHVPWDRMRDQPARWLVGSSDVTALHEAVSHRLGLSTLYGPMIASEVFAGDHPNQESVERLQSCLFTGARGLTVPATSPLVLATGTAFGPVVGGNLALVVAGIGTPDSVRAAHSLAFLEDVGEQPYRVDRMLTQLLRSGWFDSVRGVALGSFVDCGQVEPVLRDRLGGLGVPVLGGLPVGHGPEQHTLPLGGDATLDTESGTLTFH
jgi:muramoyltetrapeptide carboxypeptidase